MVESTTRWIMIRSLSRYTSLHQGVLEYHLSLIRQMDLGVQQYLGTRFLCPLIQFNRKLYSPISPAGPGRPGGPIAPTFPVYRYFKLYFRVVLVFFWFYKFRVPRRPFFVSFFFFTKVLRT